MKGKRASKVENRIQRIKKRTIPMLFKMTPNPLNGIVLAMVRRIVGKLDIELIQISHLGQTEHKLGSATLIFRSIIKIEQQCANIGKAFSLAAPKINQAIHDKITGHFRLGKVEKEFFALREIESKGCHFLRPFALKIMV